MAQWLRSCSNASAAANTSIHADSDEAAAATSSIEISETEEGNVLLTLNTQYTETENENCYFKRKQINKYTKVLQLSKFHFHNDNGCFEYW